MGITDKLVKRFNSDKVFTFEKLDPFSEHSSWISTGSPSLDVFLKTWGIPGGIIEICGDSQAGKTTFSLMMTKSVLEEYGEHAVVVILSSERRDNKPYAKKLGIDLDKVLIIRVRNIEDVFNKMYQTIETVTEEYAKEKIDGAPKFLFIWDSLGQTISAQEARALVKRAKASKEEDEEKSTAAGSAARALGLGMRGFIGNVDDHDATLLIINRPVSNVDGTPGNSSFGGKAIKLFPTIRIELARVQAIKKGEEEIGQLTKVKTVKTDFDKPKQKFNVEIGYGLGFVLTQDDIELGVEAGFLKKLGENGASFMKGKLEWKNRPALYKLYEQNNPLLRVLHKKLTAYAREKVVEIRKEM